MLHGKSFQMCYKLSNGNNKVYFQRNVKREKGICV